MVLTAGLLLMLPGGADENWESVDLIGIHYHHQETWGTRTEVAGTCIEVRKGTRLLL